MKRAHIAAVGLALPWALSLPCAAGELDNIEPSTQIYLRIPVGPAASREERMPSFGLAIKGRGDYQTFTLDSRLVTRTLLRYDAGAIGGVEVAKILIVGGVAAGAAVMLSQRTKSENNQQQQQDQKKAEQQQQQQQQVKDPCTC